MLGDEKTLLSPCSGFFSFKAMEPFDDVGNIIRLEWSPFVVKAVTIRLHIVEPYLIGSAVSCFGEYDNGSGNPGIWLEDA